MHARRPLQPNGGGAKQLTSQRIWPKLRGGAERRKQSRRRRAAAWKGGPFLAAALSGRKAYPQPTLTSVCDGKVNQEAEELLRGLPEDYRSPGKLEGGWRHCSSFGQGGSNQPTAIVRRTAPSSKLYAFCGDISRLASPGRACERPNNKKLTSGRNSANREEVDHDWVTGYTHLRHASTSAPSKGPIRMTHHCRVE